MNFAIIAGVSSSLLPAGILVTEKREWKKNRYYYRFHIFLFYVPEQLLFYIITQTYLVKISKRYIITLNNYIIHSLFHMLRKYIYPAPLMCPSGPRHLNFVPTLD